MAWPRKITRVDIVLRLLVLLTALGMWWFYVGSA